MHFAILFSKSWFVYFCLCGAIKDGHSTIFITKSWETKSINKPWLNTQIHNITSSHAKQEMHREMNNASLEKINWLYNPWMDYGLILIDPAIIMVYKNLRWQLPSFIIAGFCRVCWFTQIVNILTFIICKKNN